MAKAKKPIVDEEVSVIVRVDESLRDAFQDTCRDMDTNASREIRAFMRTYIKKHSNPNLF
jgi:antitoxin component of RelBE/YafQ-DinJ toxin-antitoxin module